MILQPYISSRDLYRCANLGYDQRWQQNPFVIINIKWEKFVCHTNNVTLNFKLPIYSSYVIKQSLTKYLLPDALIVLDSTFEKSKIGLSRIFFINQYFWFSIQE